MWHSGKENACNTGEVGSIPGSGRSPEWGMATHSSILAWEIPWTEEPGGLQSRGLHLSMHAAAAPSPRALMDENAEGSSLLGCSRSTGTQMFWSGVSDLAWLWQSPPPTVLSPLVNEAVKSTNGIAYLLWAPVSSPVNQDFPPGWEESTGSMWVALIIVLLISSWCIRRGDKNPDP